MSIIDSYDLDELREKAAEVDRVRAENERLRAALQEISQPLVTMQDRARAEGYDFNGAVALNIIANPEHYRQIARRALEQLTRSE